GHLDHVGRLPLLVKLGYQGRFYATRGTRDIAKIILRDAAFLQVEDYQRALRKAARAGRASEVPGPLFDVADAEEAISRFTTVELGAPLDVGGGVRVTYESAGHILGSAYLVLEAEGRR